MRTTLPGACRRSTSPAGTFTYTYRGAGNLWTNLALPNSARITNAYDSVTRLTETRLLNNLNSTLNKHLYTYNTGNQRTQQTFPDNSTANYTYDNIGQLKVADSSIATEDRGYLYDAAWNLNQRTNNGATTAFNVNVKNELTSVGGSSCTYDDNGNLIFGPAPNNLGYSYDAENQLVSVEAASNWRTEFVYDGRGRLRVRKEFIWVSGWSPNGETRYLYDGLRVIQERDLNNTPAVSYTRGNDLSGSLEGAGGIGGLLARSDGYSGGSWTSHAYYYADGNGNITSLTDGSQSIVASYRYDPYGNIISSSGTLAGANLYRFSSKEQHANSGMYYYGYRFYDPNLQRWINRDPLHERGGINLFRFVGHRPLSRVDRFGL